MLINCGDINLLKDGVQQNRKLEIIKMKATVRYYVEVNLTIFELAYYWPARK